MGVGGGILPIPVQEASNCRPWALNGPGSRAKSRAAPERKNKMSALAPSSGFSSSCHMHSQGWLLFPKQILFLGLDEGAPQTDGHGLGDFLGSPCAKLEIGGTTAFQALARFGHCSLASEIRTTELIKTSRFLRLKKDCTLCTNQINEWQQFARGCFLARPYLNKILITSSPLTELHHGALGEGDSIINCN